MSQPDDLRAEFEAFRDETRSALRVVSSLDADESAARRANTATLNALRDSQLEHGRRLDAQHQTLQALATSVAALVIGQEAVKADVADLKTDVADLKTDVADLKTNVTGILRILEERLPG